MHNRPLRVQLHDFGGYAFAAELSRELARRGMLVEHIYSAQIVNGKGRLEAAPGDALGLRFRGLVASTTFEKYSAVGRVRFELAYARAWIDALNTDRPDVVVASNVPLFTTVMFRHYARRSRLPWVLWHQDIISLALAEEARRKLPGLLAWMAEALGSWLERGNVKAAARVVAISDEFRQFYRDRWKLGLSEVSVIPNWAPLDELAPSPVENGWARRCVPDRGSVQLLYAGTLGRKHDPGLLVDLIAALELRGVDARLVVASEGEGADVVAARSSEVRPGAVRVIPFQPADDLREMLGSADVLVALLEPAASKFSIPSKVLTYLAAGRTILGFMPKDNPAAVDIELAGGFVVPPTQAGIGSAVEWVAALAGDQDRMAQLGRRARALAEGKFGIEGIADQFAAIFEAARAR